jgi:NAD(P)-dependent dehydrogenase (short-subunit alcohol dehydrogenase family)
MSVAIVTGANRGIGKQVAIDLAKLGYMVIITGRNKEKIVDAAREIREITGISRIEPFVVDVSNTDQIEVFVKYLETHFDKEVEVLINNAGVLLEKEGETILDFDKKKFDQSIDINAVGPLNMALAIIPLMAKRGKGKIINLSSIIAQLGSLKDDYPYYRLSKLALNGITKMLATSLKNEDMTIISLHPGWVKTETGGKEATIGVEEASKSIIWAITKLNSSDSGKFFNHNKKEILW